MFAIYLIKCPVVVYVVILFFYFFFKAIWRLSGDRNKQIQNCKWKWKCNWTREFVALLIWLNNNQRTVSTFCLFFCFFFFCVSLAAINGTTINNLQVVFFDFSVRIIFTFLVCSLLHVNIWKHFLCYIVSLLRRQTHLRQWEKGRKSFPIFRPISGYYVYIYIHNFNHRCLCVNSIVLTFKINKRA